MTVSTIAGRRFELVHEQVTAAVAEVLPEPLRDHYVVESQMEDELF